MIRQVVPLVKNKATMVFDIEGFPSDAVIYIGVLGPCDRFEKTRVDNILTITLTGVKPGPGLVSLMVEGTGNPVRFPVYFQV